MENIKEIFASFGLWSLVEDISDDGDGIGDDLQLTKEGEEARRMIEQELDKAREEGKLEYILSLGWQDTNNEYVKEVLEDADRIANELSKLKDNK